MRLISKCPSKGFEILGKVRETSEEEIIECLEIARKAQKQWEIFELSNRIEVLEDIYIKLEKATKQIAYLLSKEMGKPIMQAESEVKSTLKNIKWDLENAEKNISDEITFEDDKEIHKICYEPKGTIVVISPFNYPFSLFCSITIQNLIIGNAVINKPDPSTPLLFKLIEEIFVSSKLPKGIQKFIYGGKEIGDFLVKQNIDMICFTGSTETGKYLYKIAADKMIPILMELGGSAPGIIFQDADLENIINGVFKKRFSNTGQLCHALKRLIVHESIFDEVVEKLKNIAQNQILGDYSNQNATIGSLASAKQLEILIKQFDDSIEKGANIICGGKKPNNLKGSYFEPTLLTKITRDMKVWKEEVFGPILPIISFKTIEQAIELANDTIYGLGGYIFTTNKETYKYVSTRLKTGMVSQNNISYIAPHNPFGGIKCSGLGRIRGKWGLRELCNIKVVVFEK